MKPYRLYRVVRNLAIALATVPLLLVLQEAGFLLMWNGYLAVATFLAVLLGVLRPYRSDHGLTKGRKVLFALLSVPALLQLVITWLWLVYLSGFFGILHNVRFALAVRGADKVVIRDGGGECHSHPDREPALYVITNKEEIAEFNDMIRFGRVTLPCLCCGYPGVDWWKGDKRIVLTAVHHGPSLRWRGFGGDAHFTPGSAARLREWFMRHCDMDIKDSSGPRYRDCWFQRRDVEHEAGEWAKAHDGRKPSLDDLREAAPEDKKDRFSCPYGGTYSLTFDEQGNPAVTCSAPGHDYPTSETR